MFYLIQKFKELLIRLKKRHTIFTTTYPGFPCRVVDKSSFLFMYEEIFKKEIYNFKTEKIDPKIIDCGANIGLATLYFMQRFPQAHISSFEPDPKIFSLLTENVSELKQNQTVELIQACLSSEDGNVTFTSDDSDGGSISKVPNEKSFSVPSLNLEKYINDPIDFLKIDIEGAELEVLQTIKDKLHLVSQIFVEYHSFAVEDQKLDRILNILNSAGFRYYIEHIGVRSDHPYYSRTTDHNMDLQLNIYGYRK